MRRGRLTLIAPAVASRHRVSTGRRSARRASGRTRSASRRPPPPSVPGHGHRSPAREAHAADPPLPDPRACSASSTCARRSSASTTPPTRRRSRRSSTPTAGPAADPVCSTSTALGEGRDAAPHRRQPSAAAAAGARCSGSRCASATTSSTSSGRTRACAPAASSWPAGSTTRRRTSPSTPTSWSGRSSPSSREYLKTITFWVNADQLCVLQHGAYHHHAWGEPDPVTVPFGSGCSELVVPFRDLDRPQAVIGGTDIAMRDGLPPGVLAFTRHPAAVRAALRPGRRELPRQGVPRPPAQGARRVARLAAAAAPGRVRYHTPMTSREALRRLNRNREKLRTHHVRHIAVFGSTARDQATRAQRRRPPGRVRARRARRPLRLRAPPRLPHRRHGHAHRPRHAGRPAPEMRDEIVAEAIRAF